MRLHPDSLPVRDGQTHTLALSVSPTDIAASAYLYVPLEVAEGITRLDVTLDYARAEDCLVDIGLFDTDAAPFPAREGFRGWSGGARSEIFVARDSATPGYVPGEIPAGRWLLILGLVRLPEGSTELRLTARGDAAPRPRVTWTEPEPPVRPGAGWYRGDCQCHTFHSDARGSPETLHAQATRAGLDFLFVTDHNTCSGWPAYFAQASSADLLFLPGIEITVPGGHGNALGVDRWVDFRMERPDDPQLMVEEVRAAGGLFSINHDKPDIPWRLAEPRIDCMEVWQSHWLAQNHISRARYDARLARGRRITAIGGSDWHQPGEVSDSRFALGTPTTVLHCTELSQPAVMDALRAGLGYVTEGPTGPHLETRVDGVAMGGVLPVSQGCVLEARTTGASGDALVVIADGEEIARHLLPEDGLVRVPLPAGLRYVRAEIEAQASRPRLVAAFLDAYARRTRPRTLDDLTDDGRPILRALGNPHYFGDWT